MIDQILTWPNLCDAWERMADNRGAPGPDKVSIARFARNWEENLRHRQYARGQDPAFCLALTRSIVDGKLRNSRAFALRLARTRPHLDATPLERVDAALAALPDAKDLDTVRGLEGSGARAYFNILRQALRPAMGFDKRTRRPPRDPVNALLSLGYSLLNQNFMTACEIVGLDPYDGFLHADKYGKPALALDLMEEFRSIIADSVALNLVNRRRIGPDDFVEASNGGVYLKRKKLRVFFQTYTARINTEVIYPPAGRKLSYQKIFEAQTRRLRRVIEGREETYRAFRTR